MPDPRPPAPADDSLHPMWTRLSQVNAQLADPDLDVLATCIRDDPAVGPIVLDQLRTSIDALLTADPGRVPFHRGCLTMLGHAVARSGNRACNAGLIALWQRLFPPGWADEPDGAGEHELTVRETATLGLDEALAGTFDPANTDRLLAIVGDPQLRVPPIFLIEALGRHRVVAALPVLQELRGRVGYVGSLVPAIAALTDDVSMAAEFEREAVATADPDTKRDLFAAADAVRRRLGPVRSARRATGRAAPPP